MARMSEEPRRPHVAASGDRAKATASRRAYEWVRARILSGAFAGGRLLSEGEVADAVGVSRTPVREAFLQLAAEGMLTLYPKRGALVVPVSADELREVLVARNLIEPWAAGVVAGKDPRDEDVAAMRRLIARSAKVLERADAQGFHEADRQFHEYVVSAAGNRLVAGFYSSLHDLQIRGGSLAVRNRPSRGEESLGQHAAIADAIERGDGELAASLAHEHVHDTARALGLSALA
jgi:DNA-binding GntR family transcriptional regulator